MITKTGKLSEERREFLKKVGSITVMSTVGLNFFTACSSDDEEEVQPTTPPPTADPGDADTGINVDGNTITIDLTKQTDLTNNGGWLLITEAAILVVNTGSYNALDSVCTHTGCSTSWEFSGGLFECTCHGSQFETNGSVVRGPAEDNLQTYSTSLSGDILTITK